MIPKIAARELVHFQVVVYLGLDWIFPHFNLIHVEIFHTAISYGKANIVQFVFICCSSFTHVNLIHIKNLYTAVYFLWQGKYSAIRLYLLFWFYCWSMILCYLTLC